MFSFVLLQKGVMRLLILSIVILFNSVTLIGQNAIVEGYTYESGNRGYLNNVSIDILLLPDSSHYHSLFSNREGYFKAEIPQGNYLFQFDKETYHEEIKVVNLLNKDKEFLKVEMNRKPGYLFEVTLAEKKEYPEQVVDAISGALIEVYNNTTEKEVMVIKDSKYPHFKVSLEKGNHYTLLVRKKGFIAKQMEAYVDVEGCILCFEGVGNIDPGVTDNLTQSGAFGVLLANVELDRLYTGKTITIDNLYYPLGKYYLNKNAKRELDKVILLLNNNPNLTIELGSHCDSRGGDQANMVLSQQRAKTAVKYIVEKGGFDLDRISFKGYGESQLINHCGNGVRCSEKEHALNRRTEIKILGVDEIVNYIPLSKMKEAEKFRMELEDSFTEEVVLEKEIDHLLSQSTVDESNISEEKFIRFIDPEIDSVYTGIHEEEETKEFEQTSDVIVAIDTITNNKNYKVTNHILIKRTKKRMRTNDKIFSEFVGVRQHIEDDWYYYYIGQYESEEAALDHLSIVQEKYEESKLFQLADGKIYIK